MSTATHEPLTYDTHTPNALLQLELAAVETYTQAISKFDDLTVIGELQSIRAEHGRAERELRDHVVALGGVPARNSGPWGTFTALVTGSVKALGPATLLAALRQGEEQTSAAFEDALTHDDLHPDGHRIISSDLLPSGRKHVDALNRLLGGSL